MRHLWVSASLTPAFRGGPLLSACERHAWVDVRMRLDRLFRFGFRRIELRPVCALELRTSAD